MHEIDPVLQRYSFNCQPRNVEPLGSAGGMSGAQFWRIEASCGTLILRRWPQEHPTADRLRFIHAVLHHAAKRGVTFLSLPIRATTGQSFLRHDDYLWQLDPWMPGEANYNRMPSVEKLRAALQALARFHIALADFDRQPDSPSPSITRRLIMLQGLQSSGSEKLSSAITDSIWPELTPLAHQFVAALSAAIPRAIAQLAPLVDLPLPLQPCLRDIWQDHILFTGNEVTGFIDFGAIDIDAPACDVARLLGSLCPNSPRSGEGQGERPFDAWREGLAAYSAVRSLSRDEIHAVTALDTSGTVLAGCNWLRWIYIDGRHFENHQQVIDRIQGIVARCEQASPGDNT